MRHGEVEANRRMAYLGHRDDPLTGRGVDQAAGLARWLGGRPLDGVLTSPLQRARETARPIAEAAGLEMRVDPRLSEQSFGEWEGLTRGEVLERGENARQLLARWESDPGSAPPGGESLRSVQRRITDLVREEVDARPGGRLVLVSHVGPIKALLCRVLELPLTGVWRMFLDSGTVSVVDWSDRPLLRVFNAAVGQGRPEGRRELPSPD